jgi:hypothetical protein
MSAPAVVGPSVDRIRGGDWREWLARFGLVGKGVVHLGVGYAAWQLARNPGTDADASSSGAVGWVGDQPGGSVLLWVLAASLVSLAAWRAVEAVSGDPVDDDDPAHRVAFAVKALVYGGLAVVCVRTAAAGAPTRSGASDDESARDAAGTVFDLPMGRWIVFGIGVGIMAIAVHLVAAHTIDGRFLRRLTVGDGSVAALLGRVGYGLRSVAYVLVGWFLAAAGLTHHPDRVDGLSGVLRRTAGEWWGPWCIGAAALGFAAYGVYCFFESALRRDA